MHIPDGYLSPSTCATLYAASAPFWYVALRRVKAALSARTVPLIGVFSAFSFVIMMFNLPLPGGTTGHAVGMAMAAIILGPAVSIVAISMALLIQALFFGDGGITAYGANCFNMAIVGSLVAYAVYKVVAGRTDARARRRVVAAALAGYAAINAAAFCAAIEFGIQPLLFHDAAGTPLYAPYPLTVAVPAMMLGHLTIAGLAEAVISAGLVSYLQRTNVEMLGQTAEGEGRRLRVALGAFVVLTPLGILAAGTAWGEWKVEDLAKPPTGLAHLAKLWRAPFAEYAPSFVHNAWAAYALSAIIGVSLILFVAWFVRLFVSRSAKRNAFIEKTLQTLLRVSQETFFAEQVAQRSGLLQGIDPRAKLAGLMALIFAVVASQKLWVLAAIFTLAAALALVSHISLRLLATRVWLPVLAFSGIIALPVLATMPTLEQGARSASFLVLRAETAGTLAALLILSTVWSRLLQALRFLRVPATAITVAGMTYRYIFVFIESAKNLLEARQTRLVGRMESAVERRLAAASVGALLDKSIQMSGDVHVAMRARGFRGDVRLLDGLEMGRRDWLHLAMLLAIACTAIGLGR